MRYSNIFCYDKYRKREDTHVFSQTVDKDLGIPPRIFL